MKGEMQFAALNGFVVPPMWIAMFAQRHKHVYGTRDEDFGHIAITTRKHASANPHAMQRQVIDMDDYLSARWICEPFRLYDCCLETDGAVALVVTTLERARSLRHVPVRIAGFGEAHTHGGSWTNFPICPRCTPPTLRSASGRAPVCVPRTWTSPACTTASPAR